MLATLGSGGEAQIVKALDRQHDRFVALKIRPVRDEAAREELLGEARVLLALPPHPALPLVREDFFDGDDYVVAMDWVDGTDLATLLAERGRPGLAPSSVLAYLAQAAEALTHLHSQSPPVIHGDVKPGNLILTKGGRIKLVDFGLSSAPNAPRRRAGTPGLPRARARRRRRSVARERRLRARRDRVRAADRLGAGRRPARAGRASTRRRPSSSRPRSGSAWRPTRRAARRRRASWSSACGPAGRPALPTGVVTFCFSDIEGSTALWDARSGGDGRGARAPRRADRRRRRGARRQPDQVDGRGRLDRLGVRLGAAPRSRPRSPPTARWRPRSGRPASASPCAGASTPARPSGATRDYFGPTVNLAARVRAAGRRRPDLPLRGDRRARRRRTCPTAARSSTSARTASTGVGAPERIHALAGPGVAHAAVGDRVPVPRPARVRAGRPRASSSAARRSWPTLIGRLAPGRLLAVVGASGSGKSSVLRAGVVAAVRAGEVDGLERRRRC